MKETKILRACRLFLVIAVLILEALPYGAVCNFATPEETIRKTFSYFSLVPYGYANFAPFICAVLTCILFILSIVSLLKGKPKAEGAILWVSLCASVISLAPLLLGIRFFSIVGAVISALFFAVFVLSFFVRRCYNA